MARGAVGEVLVGLVAEVVNPALAAQGVISRRSASSYTAPVGLFGDTVTIARVRRVMAAASASTRGW
jgi:hypothetical protein